MQSINKIKSILPRDFIENLYVKFSPLTVDKILIGMRDTRNTTLRVNTLKYDIQSLMRLFKEINIKFERVSWYEDALIIKNANEKDLMKLDIFNKGYIYLQSLSSMIPPIVLNPKFGEKVLDLTAAPGSKTTQIACLMQNNGEIIANELDKIRCERLKYNIELQGAKNVKILNERGEKLFEKYEKYFDKVLLDAPCSGEGRFIATLPGTYRDWSQKRVNQLVKIQKKLLESAYKSLKNEGELVYSTCTLNEQENEEVLNWALENLDLKLIDINIQIRDILEITDSKLKKAIKILPTKNMEGFFVAKFKKTNIVN